MDFQISDIVTVVKEDSFLRNEQGEVIGTEDKDTETEIIVFFGEEVSIIDYVTTDGKKIFYFGPDELRKEIDWNPEVKANRTFGHSMWHTVRYDKSPLGPDDECDIKGCPDRPSKRGMINIWGTVYELNLCDEHHEHYNGKCMDDIPTYEQEQRLVHQLGAS